MVFLRYFMKNVTILLRNSIVTVFVLWARQMTVILHREMNK